MGDHLVLSEIVVHKKSQIKVMYLQELKICIQWNPSIAATIGECRFGLYRGVALSQGVWIRWNGTVEWNGGMEQWNGIV